MAETVRIDGLKELGEALKGLRLDMAQKAARQAVAAGASLVRAKARENAPEDTGNLKKAIVMKRKRNTKLTEEFGVSVRVGKKSDVTRAKAGKGALGKDAYYARFLEFGTVKKPIPKPFLTQALSENIQDATEAMKVRLAKRIAIFKARQ
jgi:HK97 gp10 family phage protein